PSLTPHVSTVISLPAPAGYPVAIAVPSAHLPRLTVQLPPRSSASTTVQWSSAQSSVVVRTVRAGVRVLPSQAGSRPRSVSFTRMLALLIVAVRCPSPLEPNRQAGSSSVVARHAGRQPLGVVLGAVTV